MSHQAEKCLLTAKQAATYLGIALYTLKKMEYAGYLKPYRTPGGHHRYSQQMLDEYLDKSTEFSYNRGTSGGKNLDPRPGSEKGV